MNSVYFNIDFAITFLMIVTLSSLITLAITFHPKGNSPSCRKVRGIIYIINGLAAGDPFFAGFFLDFDAKGLFFYYWMIGGILYITGALIYILRIPERFKPKTFDYIGQSHNLFHIFVLIAAFVHFLGSLQCYEYMKYHPCIII